MKHCDIHQTVQANIDPFSYSFTEYLLHLIPFTYLVNEDITKRTAKYLADIYLC